MNIVTAFENAFEKKEIKLWDKIYVLIDIHDTIFTGSYSDDEPHKWLPYAKETLRLMSMIDDISIIIWSSSHPDKLNSYVKFFESNNIHIDYVNENPEVEDTALSCFNQKLYFNVGIDDKFGFDPSSDWYEIYNYLIERYE